MTISHLTSFLHYQIVDTKDFLLKLEKVKEMMTPLPKTASLAVCDVVSLYPSVDNSMGVPAVDKMLRAHPSPLGISRQCITEGLLVALQNNACGYEDGEGKKVFAAPNHGTAMGPPHAPDYVDVFMGELDEKLVKTAPVPLLTSLLPENEANQHLCLNWSRYRDDGFTILPNATDGDKFKEHLNSLHPDHIKWTATIGREVSYLDVLVSITEEGKIKTDVFSKNSNSYLSPFSCHPPSVFKGIAVSIGRRLRMICSEDEDLEKRLQEYARYLFVSGWKRKDAMEGLRTGAAKPRKEILKDQRKKAKKKIAWVTTYDPRVPSKSKIIQKNLHLLYANPLNKQLYPKNTIIGADRRRRNIGELYKPTIPRRFVWHGPREESGFHRCKRKCDTCKHSKDLHQFISPWDGRRWCIKDHLTCTTPNVIYVVQCDMHTDFMYVGSTINLKERWANHKSDANLKKVSKCHVALHVNNVKHPRDTSLSFLRIFSIEHVGDSGGLLRREIYWQANLGTLICGWNERKDFNSVLKHRIQF